MDISQSKFALKCVFKLRLGALIPRSVGWSVGLSVGPPKITKILQNFTKQCKPLQNILEDRQGSYGSMPELP